jgi:hypothetical protein
MLDGIHATPTATRNNVANQIASTDSNGYAQFGWINTDAPLVDVNSQVTRIYCSQDTYLRYQTPVSFTYNLGIITTSGSTTMHYSPSNYTPALIGTRYYLSSWSQGGESFGLTVSPQNIVSQFPPGTYIALFDYSSNVIAYRTVSYSFWSSGGNQTQVNFNGVIPGYGYSSIESFSAVDQFNYLPYGTQHVANKLYTDNTLGNVVTPHNIYTGDPIDSGSTMLSVTGTQGNLFSVTDDMTGDLFVVNDISGLPIFTVSADGYIETTRVSYFKPTTLSITTKTTHTINLNNNQVHILTVHSNITIDATNIQDGGIYILMLNILLAESEIVVSWSSKFKWSGGSVPTPTTGINIFTFIGDGNGTLYGIMVDYS